MDTLCSIISENRRNALIVGNPNQEINIVDLVIIANALGKDAPDLNGNGVVNILDLILVANSI